MYSVMYPHCDSGHRSVHYAKWLQFHSFWLVSNWTSDFQSVWVHLISSEHRLRSENLAFDIDVWYPMLKDFTFDTVFLPLRRREAIAIIHFYQTRYIKNSATSTPSLTLYDIQILHSLESAISDLLSDPNREFRVHGAFMRLCGRSPKDAEPLNRDDVRNL